VYFGFNLMLKLHGNPSFAGDLLGTFYSEAKATVYKKTPT